MTAELLVVGGIAVYGALFFPLCAVVQRVRAMEQIGWFDPDAGVIKSFDTVRQNVLDNFPQAVPLYRKREAT